MTRKSRQHDWGRYTTTSAEKAQIQALNAASGRLSRNEFLAMKIKEVQAHAEQRPEDGPALEKVPKRFRSETFKARDRTRHRRKYARLRLNKGKGAE